MNVASPRPRPVAESRVAALRHLVKDFASRAAAHDRSGMIALDNLHDLRDAGFLALPVPTAHGGAALDLRDMTDIVAQVALGDPSTALILAMHYLQTGTIVRSRTWPDALRAEVFDSIVRDGALVNALRVEPELGTPARGGLPATMVRQVGGRFLLNGRKIFSTGSTALHWGIVWARTDDQNPRVGQVLVPLDLPGVRIEESWHQLGMRATASHTIVFDNVEIPERHLIAMAPPGPAEDAVAQGNWHAIVVAALYDGIARAARDWFVGFLHDRVPANLGAPLSTTPRFQALVGEIDALLLSNRALIAHGLNRAEAGDAAQADAGLIKHLVTENAINAVGRAVAAIGNPGLSQTNPLERHYRDVLCGRIHTPQADSALLAAGRAALG